MLISIIDYGLLYHKYFLFKDPEISFSQISRPGEVYLLRNFSLYIGHVRLEIMVSSLLWPLECSEPKLYFISSK